MRKKIREFSILYTRTKAEKLVFAIVFAVFFLYAFSLVYPFLWLLLNSLKPSLQYINDLANVTPFRLPKTWKFVNYIEAFTNLTVESSDTGFLGLILNSIWYTFCVAFISVFSSTVMGYCISKFKFKLRNVIYGIAIFSMTIPIFGNTGANFKLMTDLGLYDTLLYPVITSLGSFSMNFLIMYGFFKNVSWSYAEAVFVDGGGPFTVFFKIMLPQALPAMVSLIIIGSITAWNDYMTVLLYLPSYPTLASGLYTISLTLGRTGDIPVYFAGLVISILPVVILFASFSDVIMKNFTMGGLKG